MAVTTMLCLITEANSIILLSFIFQLANALNLTNEKFCHVMERPKVPFTATDSFWLVKIYPVHFALAMHRESGHNVF